MKTLAKIAAMVVSVALATAMFGCASSDGSQSSNSGFEPKDIQVQHPGYSITEDGMLNYAFIAVNPNDGHLAQDVLFTIEAYDASGSMIAGGSDTIPALYPGTETAAAGMLELFSISTETPKVSELSIVAMRDSCTWSATTVTDSDITDSLDIVKPRLNSTDDGITEIAASIRLAQGDSQKLDVSQPMEFRAVALLFNESGQAVCGTPADIFTLSEDESSANFSGVIENAPAFTESLLYVTPAK